MINLALITVHQKNVYYTSSTMPVRQPLLFIHGSGGGHHHWHYQLKSLSKKVETLAVDLPGHGRSGGLPFDNVSLYADWLKDFVITAGLDRPILAGHSLGGAIALQFALSYPGQYIALILIGTGGKLRVIPEFLASLKLGSIPTGFSSFLYGSQTQPALLKMADKELQEIGTSLLYNDLKACDSFNIIGQLEQIDKPSLVICGEDDMLTPLKYSRFLAKSLPKAKLATVAGAGHMVMLEKPGAVNHLIRDFCKELTETRP